MIDDRRIAELRVWGFTIIHDVLDKPTAARMRDFVIDNALRIGVEQSYRGTARHLANLVTLDPMFLPIIDHPAILPYIETMMGSNLILGSLNARVVRPGDGHQGLHGDVPLDMLRRGDDAPLMMNTVWALSDLNPDNGGTRLVPGSHQSHLRHPPPGLSLPHEMQPEVPAGSVVIFHGQTWHGGGANHGEELRAAMFGHYRNSLWMRFQCDPPRRLSRRVARGHDHPATRTPAHDERRRPPPRRRLLRTVTGRTASQGRHSAFKPGAKKRWALPAPGRRSAAP